MSGLKRCPFCGGEAIIWEGPDFYKIACQHQFECAAQVGPFDTEEEAAAAWNRRADGWIPVSEPPAERGYYLAIVKRTAPEELGGNETFIRIMRWMGEDWRYVTIIPAWIDREIGDKVTHWMPLPEPPEVAP